MTDRDDRETEKMRLAHGIPAGAPRAVKVWRLTKAGRETLEKLAEAFGTKEE